VKKLTAGHIFVKKKEKNTLDIEEKKQKHHQTIYLITFLDVVIA
jgi:hypothetical protein